MSDQKIREFRERAQTAVTAPDPDLLLYRGRALRRRRQLAPIVAVAACAAIGIGFLASGGGDARTDQQPIDQPTVTETPDPHPPFMGGASHSDPAPTPWTSSTTTASPRPPWSWSAALGELSGRCPHRRSPGDRQLGLPEVRGHHHRPVPTRATRDLQAGGNHPTVALSQAR